MEISLLNHQVSIQWKGKERLSQCYPLLQNSTFTINDSKIEDTDSLTTVSFSNAKGEPLGLKIKSSNEKGILSFHLSPNKNQSNNGDDFVGIFFKSLPNYLEGISFYKYGTVKAWTHPVQVKVIDSLNETDNQFFLWKYTDSVYGAAIPLGGQGYMATLGRDGNNFGVKSRALVNGHDEKDIPLMAIGFGRDPYKLIEDLYEEGLTLMGKGENLRKKKTYPAIFENLGWCTWNSFMHQVDESKIIEGLKTFKEKDIPVPLLIIDDGWMQITGEYGTGSLKALEVSKDKFPNGLKGLVDNAKENFGVKNVGIWHTLNGYWAGIDPKSALGEKYKSILMPYKDKVAWSKFEADTFFLPTPKSTEGNKFYDDWYTYLKQEGLSFVKVDNQLIADRVAKNNMPFWYTAQQLHSNMQNAVKKHFNGAVINCMDMTADAFYNFGSSAVARAEEDFFPDIEDYKMTAGNAAIHILCANYNSLWFSQMVWSDFDMFQSHHKHSVYHAIARAISGGPIYLTDTPGKQNPDLIRALISKDGRILRSDIPAKPTEDCLFQVQDSSPFKTFSQVRNTGLMAVFNAANADEVSGSLKPSDIHGIKGDQFAVYEHFSKKLTIATKEQSIPLKLGRMGYQLYYIAPIEDKVAPFGIVEKYNAPKTIVDFKKTGNNIEVELSDAGTFAAYVASKPAKVEFQDQVPSSFTYNNGLLLVTIPDDKLRIKIHF